MNFALIVAAGSGSRMNKDGLPKQFLEVNGIPLLIYSLKTFASCKSIDGIVIVANPAYIDFTMQIISEHRVEKVLGVVIGGTTRQQSVYNGLQLLKDFFIKKDDIVLIHDSARPLVSEKIILDNIEACRKYDAVTTAINVTDTIAVSDDNKGIANVPNRESLYAIQTPQTFKYGLIMKAHQNYIDHPFEHVTDDTSLVKEINHPVKIVEGSKENLKVTTPEDIDIIQNMINKK